MYLPETREQFEEMIEKAVEKALSKQVKEETALTITQLSKLFNRHPQTVRRWSEGLTPVNTKGWDTYYPSQFKNHIKNEKHHPENKTGRDYFLPDSQKNE